MSLMNRGEPDPGAEQGIRFNGAISAATIADIVIVDWDLIDQAGYDPTEGNWRTATA
jgi:hypothetical protein